MFKSVSSKLDVPAMEEGVLNFWEREEIFKKTVEQRKGKPEYVFFEGPPTANGRPGVHHVLARAFKDMFPRYKIMRGYHVSRRGGWDTHGLPVEIEVEKKHGFTGKRQIEEYGIAKFNEECRKSAFEYIRDWAKLTDRIAFWVDLEDAYVTYTNEYIESVWWILKAFGKRICFIRDIKLYHTVRVAARRFRIMKWLLATKRQPIPRSLSACRWWIRKIHRCWYGPPLPGRCPATWRSSCILMWIMSPSSAITMANRKS